MTGWTIATAEPAHGDTDRLVETLSAIATDYDKAEAWPAQHRDAAVFIGYGYDREHDVRTALKQCVGQLDRVAVLTVSDTTDIGDGVLYTADGTELIQCASKSGQQPAAGFDVQRHFYRVHDIYPVVNYYGQERTEWGDEERIQRDHERGREMLEIRKDISEETDETNTETDHTATESIAAGLTDDQPSDDPVERAKAQYIRGELTELELEAELETALPETDRVWTIDDETDDQLLTTA